MSKKENQNSWIENPVDFATVEQVEDAPALLEQMLEDTANADPLYRPTNYWEVYSKTFVPELKKKGLHDFRSREYGIFRSFGATDIFPRPVVRVRLPRGGGLAGRLLTKAFEVLPFVDLGIEGIIPKELPIYFHNILKKDFDKKGLDLSRCKSNRIGNPSGVSEIGGEIWSLTQLQNCRTFIDALDHFEMPEGGIVCELGPGLGRNVEIMASLFPNATFLMFDIPPQIYVLNQYMKKRFPKRLIPYEDAIKIKVAGSATLANELKGRIVILPAAKFSEWSLISIDLFWNSSSFQEMEPDVISNYLRLASKMNPATIFINNGPGGNYWGEWSPGLGGTKSKIKESIYVDELSGRYDLKSEFFTDQFNERPSSVSYVFEKR